MARIDALHPLEAARFSVQAPVEAGDTILKAGGEAFLQVVTCGSAPRERQGVGERQSGVSQTAPFGPQGITALGSLLARLP